MAETWDIDELTLPENVGLHRRTKHPKCMEITWFGKPVPAKWHLQAGYQLAFEPAAVVQALGKGAMHTFTREFPHPGDHAHEVSDAAIEAFWVDGARFPEGAYEPRCRLWKGPDWRLPGASERLEAHGLPEGCLDAVGYSLGKHSRR